jgi:hypothetical protein
MLKVQLHKNVNWIASGTSEAKAISKDSICMGEILPLQ